MHVMHAVRAMLLRAIPGQPSPIDQRGKPSQSHIRRQDNYWQNIARTETNCPLPDDMIFFLQECVGCSLNLRENMGSNWVSELPCLTSIYGRTPSPNQEKAQFRYIVRWFNTFLCPGQHSKPWDGGCTTHGWLQRPQPCGTGLACKAQAGGWSVKWRRGRTEIGSHM